MLKGGVPLKGSVKKIKHKKSKAVTAAADSDDEEQHVQQEEQAPAGAQPDTQPGEHVVPVTCPLHCVKFLISSVQLAAGQCS